MAWLKAHEQIATIGESSNTFNYVHDLDNPSPKPFLVRTSAEDRATFEANLQNDDDDDDEENKLRLKCKLCEQVKLEPSNFDEPDILPHMADV
jgi:hypothetical protein